MWTKTVSMLIALMALLFLVGCPASEPTDDTGTPDVSTDDTTDDTASGEASFTGEVTDEEGED